MVTRSAASKGGNQAEYGGYWMIQVASKQEAVEWASRCPASDNEVIEIRQVQEMSDFPPEVQQAAGATRLGTQ